MGQAIATTINLLTAMALSFYVGVPLVSVPYIAGRDFWAGITGKPAEMTWRPSWQNIGLACGEGGSCD